jgi:hypothetical protein
MTAKQKALDCHESQRDKAFMTPIRTHGLARGWAAFHRRPERLLEAFEVIKSYWCDA